MDWVKRDAMIQALKKYFENCPDVPMAFLFGSHAAGRAIPESDVDLAVYLAEGGGRELWSPDSDRWSFRERENRIWNDVERLIHREVDLVVLNYAKPVVAWEAIRGAVLTLKDEILYLDYLLLISDEAIGFQEWAMDLWRLKQGR